MLFFMYYLYTILIAVGNFAFRCVHHKLNFLPHNYIITNINELDELSENNY